MKTPVAPAKAETRPCSRLPEEENDDAMPQSGSTGRALARDLDGNFEHLVREYQDCLYRLALRMTNHREDAEEIVQDAFVRVYQALKSYPRERIRGLKIRPWLYRVTLNVARNRLRRRRHFTAPIDARAETHADPADGPHEHLVATRRRRDLATLLAALPIRYRVPLILRYVEEMKLTDIAWALGQPLGTAKSNVHRGLSMLRAAILKNRAPKKEET